MVTGGLKFHNYIKITQSTSSNRKLISQTGITYLVCDCRWLQADVDRDTSSVKHSNIAKNHRLLNIAGWRPISTKRRLQFDRSFLVTIPLPTVDSNEDNGIQIHIQVSAYFQWCWSTAPQFWCTKKNWIYMPEIRKLHLWLQPPYFETLVTFTNACNICLCYITVTKEHIKSVTYLLFLELQSHYLYDVSATLEHLDGHLPRVASTAQ